MSEENKFSEGYRQEALELLVVVEESILDIEENPENFDAINSLFRAMHTIKGSGAMFGFDDIAAFTHHVETAMDKVREGLVPITGELINLVLSSSDHIKKMLDTSEGIEPEEKKKGEAIIAALMELIPDSLSSEKEESKSIPPHHSAETESKQINTSYRIRFKPDMCVFATGMDPVLLLDELNDLGDCRILAMTDHLPLLDDFNPESFYLAWDITLTSTCGLNAVKDVFIFVEDDSEISISVIQEHGIAEFEEDLPKLGDILVDRGELSKQEITKALDQQKRIGEVLVEEGVVSKEKINSALKEQQALKNVQQNSASSSVRVPSGRLDKLINLVGELVITQASLTQVASDIDHTGLAGPVEDIERLTGELRDNVLNIRMMPIGTTFSKLRRLVRDLSSELGKQIQLTTSGAETEMDKTILERLEDPLVHLIRNSIDHGIETKEIREKNGKPSAGTISLSAAHIGTNVIITIQDDGAGLNVENILKKAREKSLVSENDTPSEKQIFNLIFAPGFSTAQTVTSVSGRGVGMDVVKKTIDTLRGTIEVDSQPGKGTIITLKLPLTLAIINGLLVTIDKDFFVLPLMSVEECVEMGRMEKEKTRGRDILNVRGEMVPYIRLRDHFGLKEDLSNLEHVVIADVNSKRIGFVVDHVIGGHQTVIKTLGPIFRNVNDISGATILGDGTVALILDTNVLLEKVDRNINY
ncbi:chemotaxis protein CheA [Desulfospira joergensenii]|uniref:chemotaxis protein CheA n=1 Tax=Desulfospira joergensenii TaxID=53329 RepID=UPI0003B3B2B6|nr:chemotaxis protein CheA [Desulfospira joergensenii]